jgi:hypothetical protein
VLLRPEPAGNLFFSTFGVLLKPHYSPTIQYRNRKSTNSLWTYF